jgi:membrane protease subunit (stomatin/prohibitin family)
MASKKSITVKYDTMKIKLTEEYIEAVKNLLIAEIKMMRIVHKKTADCWHCGCAEIKDMCNCGYLEMTFGSREDVDWVKSCGQIFVTVE